MIGNFRKGIQDRPAGSVMESVGTNPDRRSDLGIQWCQVPAGPSPGGPPHPWSIYRSSPGHPYGPLGPPPAGGQVSTLGGVILAHISSFPPIDLVTRLLKGRGGVARVVIDYSKPHTCDINLPHIQAMYPIVPARQRGMEVGSSLPRAPAKGWPARASHPSVGLAYPTVCLRTITSFAHHKVSSAHSL